MLRLGQRLSTLNLDQFTPCIEVQACGPGQEGPPVQACISDGGGIDDGQEPRDIRLQQGEARGPVRLPEGGNDLRQ